MQRLENLGEGYDLKQVVFFGMMILLTIIVAKLIIKFSITMVLGASIAIIIFIISFLNGNIALYILIFSMLLSPEFGMRETGGGGATVRLDDFLLIIITGGWLAKMAVKKDLGLITRSKLTLPIFLYFAFCLLSTILGTLYGNVNLKTGLMFVLKYFEYFIVYFMVLNHLKTRKQAELYIVLILITCMLVCLIAFYQVPAGGRVSAPFEGKSGEPNTLGGYLVLILSIIGGIYLNAPFSRTMRLIFTGGIGLIIIVILATQSRGSWLAMIVMYLLFILLSKKRFVLFAILLAGIALSPFIMPSSVKERIQYTFTAEKGWASKYQESIGGQKLDTSTSARIRDWKEALDYYKSKPFFGYGVTGWKFIDSQFMRTLIETGVFGLSAFLFLLGTLIHQTYIRFKNTDDLLFKGIFMGFFIGTIAMIVHGLSANTFIIVRIMEPFWFLAGIVMVSPNFLSGEKKNEFQNDIIELGFERKFIR